MRRSSPSAAQRPRTPRRPAPLRELLGNGSFILLVLYFTLPALAGWVVRDWMPAILKEEFGIGQGQAGVSATLYWQAAAIVGAVAGGWLADRWMRRSRARPHLRRARIGMALIVPAMFGVGYAPQTGLLWVAVAFLVLFGLGWGFFDCNNMPILCQIVRPELRATGYGIMNLVSISCGGFADWGFGMLRDRHVPLFGIFGVFASAAVLSTSSCCSSGRARRSPAPGVDRRVAEPDSPGEPGSCNRSSGSTSSCPRRTRRFTPTDRSRPTSFAAQAAFFAANGIRTVFITGTTGECHSLTCAERLALYEAWAAAGTAHGLAVIAHVGGNSIEDARALARRARELELVGHQHAGAVVLQAAHAGGADRLVRGHRRGGAGPAVLLLRHSRRMTGVSLPIDRFLVEAPARIPSLAGVKFTNPDLVSYRRCLDAAGRRFDLPWGVDEALLAALATGARGGVGSTYNWAPKLMST